MECLLSVWSLVIDGKYTPFWTAMAPISTIIGFAFIYWQIRHGVNSGDVDLVFSLRDRFWSPDMVEVRKAIKSAENIDWLKKVRSNQIAAADIKVYSPEHITRFTIFDYFESIGALCRRNKRMLKLIDPIFGADILFHYTLHENFYNHEAVRNLYPEQHFKYIAQACKKRRSMKRMEVSTFDEIVANI